MCVNSLPKAEPESTVAGNRTHDLLIASPALTTTLPSHTDTTLPILNEGALCNSVMAFS